MTIKDFYTDHSAEIILFDYQETAALHHDNELHDGFIRLDDLQSWAAKTHKFNPIPVRRSVALEEVYDNDDDVAENRKEFLLWLELDCLTGDLEDFITAGGEWEIFSA